jgi:hypothetical protein
MEASGKQGAKAAIAIDSFDPEPYGSGFLFLTARL